MDLHVVHVVRDLDAASGGPSRSVPALAAAQSRVRGIVVSVVFRDRGNARVQPGASEVRCIPLRGPARGRLKRMADSAETTVFHLHGLWDPLVHGASRMAHRSGCPYVVSTRGMLAGWALRHKALKKKLAWSLYQRRDLRQANCLLASSPFEAECIGNLLPGRRIEVIPNGCDDRPAPVDSAFTLPGPESRWALALGRLHPVKGYAELIDAWAQLRPPGWKLAIAGPDENGYRAELERKIGSCSLEERVVLLGEVDDAAKWSLLDQCELFLAPSHTENFGMAIAEALQSGTPVLTTTGTPWQELPEHRCGWWVPLTQAALTDALRSALELPAPDLSEMGLRGRRLIADRYSWDGVAARTVEVYRSILVE